MLFQDGVRHWDFLSEISLGTEIRFKQLFILHMDIADKRMFQSQAPAIGQISLLGS